jgi:type VI protein secretion system component Hcp
MIVARLKRGGTPITGSSGLAMYPAKDGWFPIQSFNFGLDAPKTEDSGQNNAAGGGATAGATAGRGNTGRATAGASARGGASGGGKKEGDFTEMSLSKEIDATTCYLMWLAMVERKSKKGVHDKSTADIHVLSSVTIDNRRHIYPSLMIHLEGVAVQAWSVSANGDERPSENIGLKYDKAAMNYRATPDGKQFQDHPPGGMSWDQTTQDSMNPPYTGFNEFLA